MKKLGDPYWHMNQLQQDVCLSTSGCAFEHWGHCDTCSQHHTAPAEDFGTTNLNVFFSFNNHNLLEDHPYAVQHD